MLVYRSLTLKDFLKNMILQRNSYISIFNSTTVSNLELMPFLSFSIWFLCFSLSVNRNAHYYAVEEIKLTLMMWQMLGEYQSWVTNVRNTGRFEKKLMLVFKWLTNIKQWETIRIILTFLQKFHCKIINTIWEREFNRITLRKLRDWLYFNECSLPLLLLLFLRT